jgi:uncharacterized protein YbbC (DUF1343 family)
MIEVTSAACGRQRGRATAALLALLMVPACAAGARETDPAPAAVVTGLGALLRDGPGVLEGKRFGLITNHTGIDTTRTIGLERLHADARFRLVALFSPEHSITGRVQAGRKPYL